MPASTESLDWLARTGLLCLIWALLFSFLEFVPGDTGATILVVLSVPLVLGGAEWVVKGMQLEERWRRMASFAVMVILLSFAFLAISGLWIFVLAQVFNRY
jgi:hypothetical protein